MKFRDIGRAIYWSFPDTVTNAVQALRDEGCSERKIYRPFFNETRSIFIHIPKVAGKSIAHALYGMDPKHHKLRSFESLNAEKFHEFFKFGFVRDPWSRLYSTYNHLRKQNKESPYGKFYWVEKYDSFERFVSYGLSKEIIDRYLFLNSQYSYLCDSSGLIGVDFVGRLESVDKDFNFVAGRIGSTEPLSVIGAADNRQSYKDSYTSNLVDQVAKLYEDDVEGFGYSY